MKFFDRLKFVMFGGDPPVDPEPLDTTMRMGWSRDHREVYLVCDGQGHGTCAYFDEGAAKAYVFYVKSQIPSTQMSIKPLRVNGLSDPQGIDRLRVHLLVDEDELPVQAFTSYEEAKSVVKNMAGHSRGPLMVHGGVFDV